MTPTLSLKRKKKNLICKDAEQMVIPYIQEELTNAQLRQFVDHVKGCRDCREELETYYIVYKGLMQLDEQEELPVNIIEALNEDLRISERHLKNIRLFSVLAELIKWLVNIGCTCLMIEILMKIFLGV